MCPQASGDIARVTLAIATVAGGLALKILYEAGRRRAPGSHLLRPAGAAPPSPAQPPPPPPPPYFPLVLITPSSVQPAPGAQRGQRASPWQLEHSRAPRGNSLGAPCPGCPLRSAVSFCLPGRRRRRRREEEEQKEVEEEEDVVWSRLGGGAAAAAAAEAAAAAASGKGEAGAIGTWKTQSVGDPARQASFQLHGQSVETADVPSVRHLLLPPVSASQAVSGSSAPHGPSQSQHHQQ